MRSPTSRRISAARLSFRITAASCIGATLISCGRGEESAAGEASFGLKAALEAPTWSSVVPSEADATLRNGEEAELNFGATERLDVEGDELRVTSDALVRFRFGAVRPYTRAGLRLYVIKKSTGAVTVASLGSAAWSEETVTWATRPVATATPVAALDSVPDKGWLDLDVTTLVRPFRAATFALQGETKDQASFGAREALGQGPVLVLDRPEPGPPFPPAAQPTISYRLDIQPIWDARCVSCHTATHSSGLALGAATSHALLVDVATGCDPASARVKAGDPMGSQLWRKINNDPTRCGRAMPANVPGGLIAIAPDEVAKIGTWIREGAQDN